jgi:hypothetical protein
MSTMRSRVSRAVPTVRPSQQRLSDGRGSSSESKAAKAARSMIRFVAGPEPNDAAPRTPPATSPEYVY